ncbi:MAG TPA: methyltransferase, TIGR04325 family [Hyphomicrobiales bacterium]|nr:methyltransferase, TIGR04325 family [Hyphomicrobiales bacterium]
MRPLLWRLRQKEIRLLARWLVGQDPRSRTAAAIAALRDAPVARGVFAAALGYRRPYATIATAAAAIAGHEGGGHLSADYARETLRAAARPRPSDYAALYHLQPLAPQLHHVFDFGGFVGTLYYCYTNYLDFASDLVWTVYDLPETDAEGERLAAERGERRLRFSTRLADAEGADMFVACGSIHYFEEPLPSLIGRLADKPHYVLINRSPIAEAAAPFAAVQDGGSYLLPCIVHPHAALLDGFGAIGYDLIDEWRAPEHSLMIPGYPERSVPAYSGMFLRRHDA